MSVRPSAGNLAQSEISLQRPIVNAFARNGEHAFQQVVGGFELPLFEVLRKVRRIFPPGQNLAPNFHPSRNQGLAIGGPLDLSYQKQEPRRRPEYSGGCTGRFGRPQGCIKSPQPRGVCKVCLLPPANARKHIKIRHEPAIIFCQQARNELRRVAGICAGQVLPTRLGFCSSWNQNTSVTNADVLAIKIKQGAILDQFSGSTHASQRQPGLRIHLR